MPVLNNDGLRIIITRGAQRSSSESPLPPLIWPRCVVWRWWQQHVRTLCTCVSCVLARALSRWLACTRLMLLCAVTTCDRAMTHHVPSCRAASDSHCLIATLRLNGDSFTCRLPTAQSQPVPTTRMEPEAKLHRNPTASDQALQTRDIVPKTRPHKKLATRTRAVSTPWTTLRARLRTKPTAQPRPVRMKAHQRGAKSRKC